MRPHAALGSTLLSFGVLACGSEPGPPEDAVLMTFDLPAERGSGHLAAGVGDVDGDGKPDIAVAGVVETERLPNEYVAWVYSGANGTLLHRLLTGVAAGKGSSAVSGAGDVDGDGHADVILGNRHAALEGERSGAAWVFSGRDGELLHAFRGDRAHDAFGASVASAGDVDGDGRDDVVVGAEQHAADTGGGGGGSGYVRVFSGADGSQLLEVRGLHAGDRLGAAVAGAGDLDGDGRADLLVGARARAGGYAVALSGADGRVIHRWEDLRDRTRNDVRVHSLDDQDGDEARELLVSTPNATYVYSGRSGQPLLNIVGAEGALDRAGDLDGDGKEELVFRRYQELDDGRSESAATTAAFYSGADGRLLGEVVYAPPGAFRPLNPIADLDGDGRGDLVVLVKGRVWVLSGGKLLGSS